MHASALASGYEARVEALDASEWHALAAKFDDLNIHQTVPYAQARWPRSAASHLVLRRDGEIVAAAQTRLVPIPRLGGIAYLRWGPLWRLRGRARDLEVLRQMARAIAAEYVHRRGCALQLIPAESEDDEDVAEVLREEGFVQRPSDYNTIVIDIRAPLDELRKGLEPRWRTELNRAQRSALVLTEGTLPELFDRFAPIYEEMFERKQLVERGDLEVYRRAQELLPEPMRMRVMLCSEEGGGDVAGAITSSLGELGLGILWATSPRGRELRGAYFLQWHVIDWLKREGCQRYDLGGVDAQRNPGGHRFKTGLAGKNGRELRFLGTFEASASPVVPAVLRSLVASRRSMRRLRETSRALLSREASQPRPAADTAPETPPGIPRAREAARRAISELVLPLMQRAGREHVGGETLDDAMSVAGRLAGEGLPSTLGVWDVPTHTARQVAGEYRSAIDRLAETGLDSYVSIKPPALRFDRKLAAELATAARARGVRLHADSHGPEVADASNAMLDVMLEHVSGEHLSTTIPGRWSRSVSDADWAVGRGVAVRVVKGQWPDPAAPRRDARSGYLEVIDRLAGRARHVAVASHDVALAEEAISRLRAAGTPCQLELLFGLPITRSLRWARENGVSVRIYVPYGKGYLPHAISQLRRNPRFVGWILKDMIASRLLRAP